MSGARRAEKILILQPWHAQRGEKFCNARLGHPFSLVSGARSAENFFGNARLGHLFSLVSHAHSTEKMIGNARLGHPFSLVSGARSTEKILLLQP